LKRRPFSKTIEFTSAISYKLLPKVIEGKIKGGHRSDRKTRKKTWEAIGWP
jgi:hypothetical protein